MKFSSIGKITANTALAIACASALLFFGASMADARVADPKAAGTPIQRTVPFEPPKAQKFQEDTLPETELTSSLLFQLLASEIALQNNELGAAYSTYMAMAEETGDPRLAERAVQIAQAARAAEELKAAVLLWNKLAPGNKNAQELLIQVAIHFHEYSKILPTVQTYLSEVKEPGTEILKLQGLLLLSQDRRRALSFFKKATEKFKKLPETKLGLARLEEISGNSSNALKLARESYKLRPNSESVLTLVALLLKNKPEEARKVLEAYLVKNPTDVKVRDAYAQLLLQSGEYQKLYQLGMRNLNDPDFVLTCGLTLGQKTKFAEATDLLNQVIKHQKTDEEQSEQVQKAYLLLSDISLEQKDTKKALAYCDNVIGKLKPLAALQKANIYVRLDNDKEALKILNNISTAGNPALQEEVTLAVARITVNTNGEEAALAKLEAALKETPTSKNLNYEAGMLAERLNNLDKVESYLKQAIAIDPNYSNAYNSLGYTLLEKTNRTKEAAEYIEKAYAIDPTNPYILDSMGWLSFKQKKYNEAINYLNDASQMLESEDIFLHLIEAYWASDQKEEARLTLDRARELWPESTDLDALEQRLKME
ncbi:MAG: tetratricopeptide repeat protein [Burkholderiales bacterium]|nr:tetratricopeptide repeat protein [Burkholderiales bacterium]